MSKRSFLPYLVLLVGVLVVSTSSILIRLAQIEGMPSMSIAVIRLLVASLLVAPLAWTHAGAELRHLQRRDVVLGVGAGTFLALHMTAWISSLEYTSVASSAALVTTNPIWVGLASWLLLRERPGMGTLAGIVITLIGSALIIISGLGASASAQFSNPTLGNTLSLVGALMVSGYFLIGRGLRRHLSTLAYIWLVYTSAAVVLIGLMLLTNHSLSGYTVLAYLYAVGLAVGPQLIGHTSFNWALAHLSATFVALAILGEPVGSAIMAWILFEERIDPTSLEGLTQLTGFALLLAGIYVAALGEQKQKARKISQNAPHGKDAL